MSEWTGNGRAAERLAGGSTGERGDERSMPPAPPPDAPKMATDDGPLGVCIDMSEEEARCLAASIDGRTVGSALRGIAELQRDAAGTTSNAALALRLAVVGHELVLALRDELEARAGCPMLTVAALPVALATEMLPGAAHPSDDTTPLRLVAERARRCLDMR